MLDQADRIGEGIAPEGDHRALGADIDLGDIGLAAQALDRHHLEQVIGFLGQGPEPVDQFSGQGFTVFRTFGFRQPPVEGQAHVQIGDVFFRDQHGNAGIDQRRPATIRDNFVPAFGAQLGDRVFQHLLIELDPNLADVP